MSADQCDLTQAFQSPLTKKVFHIPVRIDPKTDKSFVLWKDIQDAFENAKCIRNGVSLVPFMIDENFEQIIPLRIAYQPGVVLEVVEGNGQVHSTTGELAILAGIPLVAGGEPGHHHNTIFGPHLTTIECTTTTTSPNTPTQTVDALTVTDINTTTIGDKNQEEVLQIQSTHQQTIDKNLEEMLRIQKKALDRLAIIQNSVQALLAQTYELHNYPIPRLFIVLPKDPGLRGKLMKPFSESYRLYFLCECGTHTMAEHSKTPPEIHLAKHEGYELNRPTEFFERYGSYILAL
ncbi:hypothetical protein BGZ65_003388, partial [Modicella reniformis]